uniref:Uncharacterized protein n=1 Tax=Oryza punctata TaxID=4537 RepID=A0A0E0JYW2_ORYPU
MSKRKIANNLCHRLTPPYHLWPATWSAMCKVGPVQSINSDQVNTSSFLVKALLCVRQRGPKQHLRLNCRDVIVLLSVRTVRRLPPSTATVLSSLLHGVSLICGLGRWINSDPKKKK